MALTGVDVSHHQGPIDWGAVARAGIVYAFVKRTEGLTFTDSRGAANTANARAAGLIAGPYHFLRSNDPRGQARRFLSVIGDPRGMLCALDVERSLGGDEPRIGAVREFAAEFARLTGGHPLIIYTGGWYWRGVIGNPHGADLGPLWHSEYEPTVAEVDDGPEGVNYGGWGHATFWQFTSSSLGGDVPGIPGNEDKNLFYGDRAALLALTGAGSTPNTKDWLDMATMAEVEQAMRNVLGPWGMTLVAHLMAVHDPIEFVRDPDGKGVWLVTETAGRWLIDTTTPEGEVMLHNFQAHWRERGVDPTVTDWTPADLYAVPIAGQTAGGLSLDEIRAAVATAAQAAVAEAISTVRIVNSELVEAAVRKVLADAAVE